MTAAGRWSVPATIAAVVEEGIPSLAIPVVATQVVVGEILLIRVIPTLEIPVVVGMTVEAAAAR
jgi:hypothetical protein